MLRALAFAPVLLLGVAILLLLWLVIAGNRTEKGEIDG